MTLPLLLLLPETPAPPVLRCRGCRRLVLVGPLYRGFGPKCAAKRGLIPRPVRQRRRRTRTTDDGPGLLGLLPGLAPPEDEEPDEEPDPTTPANLHGQ